MKQTSDIYDAAGVLRAYQHIAVVGISANPYRPSHGVTKYMQAQGYDIIPVNPRYAGQTLFGKRVYASLTEAKEAGEPIEIVDVFRRAEETPPVAEEAVKVGAKALWLQLGIENARTRQIALAGGLIYIEDRCIKVEHSYLARE